MSTIGEITAEIPASNNIFTNIEEVRLQKLLPTAYNILSKTGRNKLRKYGALTSTQLKNMVRQPSSHNTFLAPFGNDEMGLKALNKAINKLPGPNTKRRRRTSRKTRRNRRH